MENVYERKKGERCKGKRRLLQKGFFQVQRKWNAYDAHYNVESRSEQVIVGICLKRRTGLSRLRVELKRRGENIEF